MPVIANGNTHSEFINNWRIVVVLLSVAWSVLLHYVRLRIVHVFKRLTIDTEWYTERVRRIRKLSPDYSGSQWLANINRLLLVTQSCIGLTLVAVALEEICKSAACAAVAIGCWGASFALVMETLLLIDRVVVHICEEYEPKEASGDK